MTVNAPEETRTTPSYFNHRSHLAEGPWGRRRFVRKWRRLGARDPLWRPPHPDLLRRTLGELDTVCLWLEALLREPVFRGSGLEVPVATAAVRRDAQQPEVGYLTLLHFVNDRASLEALFETLSEALRPHGVRTLVGPTHLLPQFGGGALSSHWHLPPPADTPYGPPYAPEHLGALMSPTDALTLFYIDTAQESRGGARVVLRGLEPPHLAGDLLTLWGTAFAAPPASPATDAEARVVLRWLAPRRPFGFSATLPEAPDTPVGFVLLCPEPVRAFRKGRDRSGRLWGGVLPGFRRQGVGRALLSAALGAAHARGWDTLSVGPVAQGTDAEAFLRACGGEARQRYTLYRAGL